LNSGVVSELPEQLIEQAEFLVRKTSPNEASLRRAVSSAYYAVFHLLVRDSIANWKHADHHSRLARMFDHKRMKDASAATLRDIGNFQNVEDLDRDQTVRFKLSTVAQAFVDLQQARHKADYDIGEPIKAVDAALDIAQARLAFSTWTESGTSQ
jgi:uncharacterized protein (UPF0332 family)